MTGPAERRVAWITGASKGIGRGLALRLARDGWTVAASARTETDLLDLAATCSHGRIHAYPLDITDPAATAAVVARVERELGGLDLAVLNAGTHRPMTADDFSVETFRLLVETNLMGAVHGLAALIPRFTDRGGGHVAVVASLAGYRGLPSAAAYGATKAGLINMAEALKPDLERRGVRLSLINPGFVDTPLTRRNRFPMPFLVSVEDAVEHIVRALDKAAFEIAFPRRFAFLMKGLRLLPNRPFFALSRRLIRE